jgi:tetratricopeptide (TPR) repeat protein
MPKYFLTSEKEAKEGSDDSEEDIVKPRTVDWLFTPFVTEWHYKITAPAGFKIRALPESKDEKLGSARFIQKYSANNDGTVVEASLKFDSGKARLTVEEAKSVRDAIVKIRSGDGISITFDHAGYSLLSAGKIREALAIDRQLVAEHPRDALQRIHLARALLTAGLGEKAKVTAREATVLNPSSPQAFSELAWILEFDQIGRRFGKGFDYDGAVAAYRKARQLDPKDLVIRANLAILLEYGPDGLRYSKKAHLEEAIQEFKELKKLDADYFSSYEDNVPYDLWYLERFKEVIDYVLAMPSSDARKGLVLASVAALEGTDAALKKSLEITSREQDRSEALLNAGRLLVLLRKYAQAAEMLAAGASGQKDENQIGVYTAILKKTHPREEFKIDDSAPTGVILKMFNLMFADEVNPAAISGLVSKDIHEPADPVDEKKQYESVKVLYRAEAERAGVSADVLFDTVLSNARFSTEGDDTLGYKITLQTPGAQPQDVFVVREDNQYKVVSFASASQSNSESIGWEVLARLKRNDLTGARKWLDWARDKIHINQGDDPLSGQPFPHFWTKGQQGDEAAIRIAALVLLPSAELKDVQLAAVVEARNSAKTDAIRTDLNLVLAYAYAQQQKWAELLGVTEELIKQSPDSLIAYTFAARAYSGLKKFDEWEKLLQTRLQAHPDEPDYVRAAASLADNQGQFARARQLRKGLIDRGSANANDLNSYAWDALYTGGNIDQDSMDAAHRASELTRNANFSILHTVACLYAASGKTKEGREFLMKAMEEGHMDEPDSSIWLALATIAEQYGENDAARAMYARVEKDKLESPTSNYSLAQQRLAFLQKESMAKVAGQ